MKKRTLKLQVFNASKVSNPKEIKGGTDADFIVIEDETLH